MMLGTNKKIFSRGETGSIVVRLVVDIFSVRDLKDRKREHSAASISWRKSPRTDRSTGALEPSEEETKERCQCRRSYVYFIADRSKIR